MEPTEQLSYILPRLSDLVDRISPSQLDDATPCDEFRVRDVLNHMIVLGGGFAQLFRGEEAAAIESAQINGQVPVNEFRAAMDGLVDAVQADGAMGRMLDTPLGQLDGATFARVVAFDGLVHGWDLAVATGQADDVDPAVVAEVREFAEVALTEELRRNGMFAAPTTPPEDATPLEALAAFTGREVEQRWRGAGHAIHLDRYDVPTRLDVPGAVARQARGFGDATGYSTMAGEYFSLGAGTDIAPLLTGLEDDSCAAPHWGYMISGEVVVTFVDGSESTCVGGELFYWPPGHSVRVNEDAEVVLFSPQHEHVTAMEHMAERLAAM